MKSLLSDLFYPDDIKCIVCGDDYPVANRYCLCPRCSLSVNETYCIGCGRATDTAGIYCDTCHYKKWSFEQARSVFVYENSVRDLVRRLKYGNARYLVPQFAALMAETYLRANMRADVVTFVPMPAERKRKRGYNQAELLAKGVSAVIGIPAAALLEKTVFTKNLARMRASERAKAIEGTFSCGVSEIPESILLIDDVFTTGATAEECAKTLKRGGAKRVSVLTLAAARMRVILC